MENYKNKFKNEVKNIYTIENIFLVLIDKEVSDEASYGYLFSTYKKVKNNKKDISIKEINKTEKEIERAISTKEKKQKELSGCEDIAFVNKKISFYDKKIDKLNKEKNKILNERKLMFDDINNFVESKGLSDIYEYIYKNINFIED